MFQGSMVALVTPMHADGSVDYTCLEKLVEMHVDAGTDAIVAVGTTGESATLNFDEHCEVVRFVVEKTDRRLPVIAGTGANSTAEALALGLRAKEMGADGMLVVTPYYNKPTQHGLIAHYRLLAGRVDLPLILYNVPGRTAVDMLPETVAVLSQVPNIVGVKEASGCLDRISELIALCPDDFVVLSGDDDLALSGVERGGKGVISVTANVAPKRMRQIFHEALSGNMTKAKVLNEALIPLHRDLFLESNPIPVKWCLHELGLIDIGIRLPMTPLSDDKKPVLRQALKQAQLV